MNGTNPPPPSGDRTVVVNSNPLRPLWILTILSLAFNGLILLFILCAIINGHHKRHHESAAGRDGGGRGGCCCEEGFHGGFHHHFGHGGFGPGRDEGFGRGGFGHGGGWGGAGFNDKDHGFGHQGGFAGPGDGRQFGAGGGGMMEKRDPAQITDDVLQHLTQTLSLTTDEQAKIKPIIQDDVTQFQNDADAWHQSMQKRFEDDKAKLKPLLNADQQKKLDELPAPGQQPKDNGGNENTPDQDQAPSE